MPRAYICTALVEKWYLTAIQIVIYIWEVVPMPSPSSHSSSVAGIRSHATQKPRKPRIQTLHCIETSISCMHDRRWQGRSSNWPSPTSSIAWSPRRGGGWSARTSTPSACRGCTTAKQRGRMRFGLRIQTAATAGARRPPKSRS